MSKEEIVLDATVEYFENSPDSFRANNQAPSVAIGGFYTQNKHFKAQISPKNTKSFHLTDQYGRLSD